LKKKTRSDLLLAAIAVRQIVNLDSEVSHDWLKVAARSLERNEAWMLSGLDILRERRLILGENAIRCPHRRFAAATLALVCEKNTSEEWPHLLRLFRDALIFGPPPLRGISWLLHELRMTDGWSKMKGDALTDKGLLNKITTRCFAATRPVDRRDALFALTALLDWHPEVCAHLARRRAELSEWLSEADPEYGAAFGDFLNQLGQRDSLAMDIMNRSDPKRIARSVSGSAIEDAAQWGRLVVESWRADPRWKRKLAANLDVFRLCKLFRRIQAADVGRAGMLLEGISILRQDLAMKMTELALPAFATALNNDPVLASSAIDRTIIWGVCGFFPDVLATKRPSKTQVALARRLVNKLKPCAIAGALVRYRQRDWEQYSRFLFFVRKVSPRIWKQIASSIDIQQLEIAAARLWSTVPIELENLLRSISEGSDLEPARTLLTRHSSDLVRLRPMLVIISPESAAERIRGGIEFDLHVENGTGWQLAGLALCRLGILDKTLPSVVLHNNLNALASGFAKLQRLEAEFFPRFIAILKTSGLNVADEIGAHIVPKVAETHWLQRASGNKSEKAALCSLLKVLSSPKRPLRALVMRIRTELARQKK
jgi:hypothetical protein